jgi:hypothetical protein
LAFGQQGRPAAEEAGHVTGQNSVINNGLGGK